MTQTKTKLSDLIRTEDPIVKYGDPVLRAQAEPVTEFTEDLPEFIERMHEIMVEAKGVGLAAPQLGISRRIIIYDSGDGLEALVNPVIQRAKGEQTGNEGCLSIPGLRGDVTRANEIVVKASDPLGNPVRIKAEEFTARVIQHEIDHLNGVMFIDIADPETLHWLTPEEIAEENEEDEPESKPE